MSEPETQVPAEAQTTPEIPATQVPAQPAVVATPDPMVQIKEELEQERAKAKRYKEQIQGKDKLIEELKIKKIVESFQPEPEVESEPEYEEPIAPKAKQAVSNVNPVNVEQSIFINSVMMEKEFGKDPDVPFTDDVKVKVEAELERLDPSGRIKLSPQAWKAAYRMVRGDMLPEIAKIKQEAIKSEYLAKDKSKAEAAAVQSAVPAKPETPGPTIDDVISGKIKMSPKDMLTKFPELQKSVPLSVLREYGIITK